MAISEQRLFLFALISEFETDLRHQIAPHLTNLEVAQRAIGNEAYGIAKTRMEANAAENPNEAMAFLESLELADELKLIVFFRTALNQRLSNVINSNKKNLFELCAIRNRVMHRRPLAFEDFPTVTSIVGSFCESCPTEFVNSRIVFELQDNDLLSKSYRGAQLEEPDALVANNLPQPDFDDTGFIGRAEKARELRKAIDGPYPVITVLGVGGVGKTALTLQVLYDLISEPNQPFEAIIWLSAKTTRLTGSDIETIVTGITDSTELASLAVSEIIGSPSSEPFSDLHEILKSFKVLLVVDNLETILDEKIRSFVRNIPAGSKILFTSRVGLGAFDFTIELDGLAPGQAISYFKRVARVWGQNEFLTLTDEVVSAYIKRLNFSPLGIKWFIQAVSKGASAQRLLGDPKTFLSFCLDNILDNLTPNARTVLSCLAIVGKDQSPASLAYLCELDGFLIDEALGELIGSNLIQVLTGRFGDDDRYKIAFLVIGYISRFKPPPPALQSRIKRRLGQLRAASEKALPSNPLKFIYDPTFLFIRKDHADTDAIAAQHLNSALYNSRRQQYDVAAEAIARARSIAPTYFEAFRVEAFIAASEGNSLLAVASYEEALALRPDYPPLLVQFAGFLMRTQDDLERGLSLLEAASLVDPACFYIQSEIVRAHMYARDHDTAWQELLKIVVDEIPNGRSVRIYYDLKVDVCRRGMEKAYLERDSDTFLRFCSRISDVLKETPEHIGDGIIADKLYEAATYARKFLYREDGSPSGLIVQEIRDELLEAVRKARGFLNEADMKPSDFNALVTGSSGGPVKRYFGVVVNLVSAKGFGFLEASESNARYFFHRRSFTPVGDFDDLALGDRLEFEIGENKQGPCASALRRLDERCDVTD